MIDARARLSREHPEWTEAQVQVAIEEWLRQRPGRGVVGAKRGASVDAVSGWASLTGRHESRGGGFPVEHEAGVGWLLTHVGPPDPASWLVLGAPFVWQLVAVCHELLRNPPFAVQLLAACHELLRNAPFAVQLLAACHELLRNAPFAVQLLAACHQLLSVDLCAVHAGQRSARP